jgi:hypothetical protein
MIDPATGWMEITTYSDKQAITVMKTLQNKNSSPVIHGLPRSYLTEVVNLWWAKNLEG